MGNVKCPKCGTKLELPDLRRFPLLRRAYVYCMNCREVVPVGGLVDLERASRT